MSKSPDAFRTISEVADWLGVQTHVLRFWESKFAQVKPVKRAGGRRYYRPADMLLLGGIRKLLHDDGLTIKGVQKILREEGVPYVSDLSHALDDLTQAEMQDSLAPASARPTDVDASTGSQPGAPEPQEPAAAAEAPAPEPEVAPLPDAPSAAPHDPEPIEAAPPPPVPEPAAPRAQVVDVPDDPVDTTPPAPGPLSKMARLGRLPASKSAEIRPLLVQLAAVRDRMASARKDARPD